MHLLQEDRGTLSESVVQGDKKVGMKSEKKSKKRKKNAATNDSEVTKGVGKAVERDSCFKVKSGEIEDCAIKRNKERCGGKLRGKSSKDKCDDAVKNFVKKKNKLKNEGETFHDSLLDSKTIAPESVSGTRETKVVETLSEASGGNIIDEVKRKKSKKEKRKKEDGQVDIVAGDVQGYTNIRKKKKTKLGHSCKELTHEKSEKTVRFSGHVQVFPPSSDPSDEEYEVQEEKLLWGKRFSKEEDEIIKDAVNRYIEVHNLGKQGLQKVLNSKSIPEIRGCWKKIGSAIPYRPYTAVYQRAQRLFRSNDNRKYTEEEYEMIRKFHGEHGPKWRVLADELGKHWANVGNTWHRIKLANRKKGNWAQEEIQTLFDLVNADLQLKLCEEKKSKHGMLRDNIRWSAISDKLSTRYSGHCCTKWYRQLTSPMVAAGEWADTDDYRLIDALFELDASCIEDVDWDNLLSHRHGELCRKRWKEMVRQISQHENKSFAAQVEVLAKRYHPDLVEAREAWDRKPVVP